MNRSFFLRVPLVFVGAIQLLGIALAQQAGPATTSASNSAPAPSASPVVSVRANSIPLFSVANALAQQSKVRVLVEPGTPGRVTLRLENVPLETAVRTVAQVTGANWRELWLTPELAPRIEGDQAARLARTLESVGNGPLAMGDGHTLVHLQSRAPEDGVPQGLRPVYVLFSKIDPDSSEAAAQPAPVVAAPEPQVAAANDPQVRGVQRNFLALTPEQQRAFVQSIRPFMRTMGGGRGNMGGTRGNNGANGPNRGGRNRRMQQND